MRAVVDDEIVDEGEDGDEDVVDEEVVVEDE